MYNDHFHTFRFAKNCTPFHILMLVVHDEMDIYLPIKLHTRYKYFKYIKNVYKNILKQQYKIYNAKSQKPIVLFYFFFYFDYTAKTNDRNKCL